MSALEPLVKVEITQPGVQFTPTSANVLDPKLTIEDIGRFIEQALGLNDSTRWWIGDLLLFAEANFSEKYAQLLDATRMTERQAERYRYVAQNIAPSRRRENLSFSHHEEVASLEPPDQSRLLALAESSGHAIPAFREVIRDHRAFEEATRPPARRQTVLPPSETDAARGVRTVRATLTRLGEQISPDARENSGLNASMTALADVTKTVKRATALEQLSIAAGAVIAAGVRQTGLPDPAVIVPSGPWDTLVAAYATITDGGA